MKIETKRKNRLRYSLFFSIIVLMILSAHRNASAQNKTPMVHIAKIQVDPAQLAAYNAALKEHAETAVRVEPGVLALYAVADKKDPTHITVFEIYADTAAYQAHLHSPHFLKYKSTVQGMVKSLELIETDPIVLAAKGNGIK